jgi:hypothetical protein
MQSALVEGIEAEHCITPAAAAGERQAAAGWKSGGHCGRFVVVGWNVRGYISAIFGIFSLKEPQ